MSFGNVLGQQTDLSQYATKSEVDSKINTAATNYLQQELIGSWNGIDASTGASVEYDFTHRLPSAFKITLKCEKKSSLSLNKIFIRTGNMNQISVFNISTNENSLQLSCFLNIIYYNINTDKNEINATILTYDNGTTVGRFKFLTNDVTQIKIETQKGLNKNSNISLYAIY